MRTACLLPAFFITLHAMNSLKLIGGYQCILLMPMQHSNVDLMKIVMVYFESFSLRKPI